MSSSLRRFLLSELPGVRFGITLFVLFMLAVILLLHRFFFGIEEGATLLGSIAPSLNAACVALSIGWALLLWEGWVARSQERLKWWSVRVLLGGVGATVATVGIVSLVLAVFQVSSAGKGPRDPEWAVEEGVGEAIAVILAILVGLALAAPGTFILLVIFNLWRRRHEGFPATRMGAVMLTMSMLLAPALVAATLWAGKVLISGTRAGPRTMSENRPQQPDRPDTPLMEAAAKGDVESVRALINSGAELNAQGILGWTALMRAANQGNVEIVNALIRAGADVNIVSWTDDTALTRAEECNSAEIVSVLIVAGAKLDVRDGTGQTPLMAAASMNRREISRLLIKAGADVNAKDDHGWTALLHAVSRGDIELVELLVNAGADVNAENTYGFSPMSVAKRRGQTRVIEILRHAGAKE